MLLMVANDASDKLLEMKFGFHGRSLFLRFSISLLLVCEFIIEKKMYAFSVAQSFLSVLV